VKLLADDAAITSDAIKPLVLRPAHAEAPVLAALDVDLASYDALFAEVGT
jgi:hypothetical protein